MPHRILRFKKSGIALERKIMKKNKDQMARQVAET
jgi:hypothetical protein